MCKVVLVSGIVIVLTLWCSVLGVRPVVIYRGLNSSCCEGKVQQLMQDIRTVFPTIYIHSIRLAPDPTTDRLYSIFDSADQQVAQVCKQLAQNPALRGGFNAIGLSQGGLLMRAYVQRCNKPPVYNLITLGAPMEGVGRLPACGVDEVKELVRDVETVKGLGWLPSRLICRVLRSTFDSFAYTPVFQHILLPAQYYRDQRNLKEYQRVRPFISEINNEFPPRNQTYIRNMFSLNRLVLYRFSEEELVVPASSTWFSLQPAANGSRSAPRWLGLGFLSKTGRVDLLTIKGAHMELPPNLVRDSLANYLNNSYPLSS